MNTLERAAIALSMADPDERGLPEGVKMAEFYRGLALAVLKAIREPDEGMIEVGNRNADVEIDWACAWAEDSYCETSAEPFKDAESVWQAMIDRIITEGEGKTG